MTSAARGKVPVDASTRFRAPTYVRNVIERPSAARTCCGPGPGRQLVVIHAPAGYGKTTLAVQWLQELRARRRRRRVARPAPRRQRPALVPLPPAGGPAPGAARAGDALDELRELIEQSAEDTQRYTLSALLELIARHERRFVLTFDDWHLIDDAAGAPRAGAPARLRAAQPVADPHQPHPARACRSPAWPVRRQLTEVDADTLRFDLAETRAFLVDLNGLPLRRRRRRAAVREHRRLGRGPAARVAVAARLRRPRRADPRLLRPPPLVGEYLAENVLGALPPTSWSSCWPPRSATGCAATWRGRSPTGADGQAMLEELERRDLFLRPLDAEREWFRYHHLFADYLRRRLERDHPERVPRLHRRASVVVLRARPGARGRRRTRWPPATSSGPPTSSSATPCRWSSTAGWSACSA